MIFISRFHKEINIVTVNKHPLQKKNINAIPYLTSRGLQRQNNFTGGKKEPAAFDQPQFSRLRANQSWITFEWLNF